MTQETPVHEEGAEPVAPSMRGRMHAVMFFVSVPAGIVLVMSAGTAAARVATLVYSLSLIGLFGASAAYHVLPWSDEGRTRMKRLDHSMIFVLIAGTYTPFALLVIEGTMGIILLSIVWVGAVVGITLKLVRIDGFRAIGGALYVVLGWLAILAFPKMLRTMTAIEIALILAGAVIYTLGAIVLLRNKPDPNPRVFGYHEVWHTAVVAACACFYFATLLVVLNT